MIFELVGKEFKVRTREAREGFWGSFLKVVGIILFVALECFLFLALDKKVTSFSGSYASDFLVLCLFIVFAIGFFLALIEARATLYNHEDAQQSLALPIEEMDIITAKMFYLFLRSGIVNLLIGTPLLVCYGTSRDVLGVYYVGAVLYAFIAALPETGLAVLLAVPYEKLYVYLRHHDLLQFALASLLCVGLCFLYRYVLQLFLSVLTNVEDGGLFSPSFLGFLHNFTPYLAPSSLIVGLYLGTMDYLVSVGVYLGTTFVLLLVGSLVASASYIKAARHSLASSSNKGAKGERPLMKPERALLKKEIAILFRDSGYTFSFTALLVMEPFFSFLVIGALQKILGFNLKAYFVYFPELQNGLTIFLLLLFSSVIASSASASFSREGGNVLISKSLPVAPSKQLLIKGLVPTSLSSLSFLLSVLAIAIGGLCSYAIGAFVAVVGLLLLVSLNAASLWSDLSRSQEGKKPFAWGLLLDYLAPFVLLGFHLLFSFLALKAVWIYLLEGLLALALLTPSLIHKPISYEKAFRSLEVAS
jgi:hypothetical protein